MFTSCLQKQEKIKKIFASLKTSEEKYQKIIEFGKKQPTLQEIFKTEQNRVHGCQSRMFLKTTLKDGLIFFETESDALISAGLAMLLVEVYSGEKPEVILKCPPTYLEEMDIFSSLSPNRSNGLLSLHLKMKQEALKMMLPRSS